MTNESLTQLLLIVDRSGSMQSIAGDMNGGIHTLLEEQVAGDGDIYVDAWTFDTKVEKVYETLTPKQAQKVTLVNPRGATALYDAVGNAVTHLGAELADEPEEDRPGKVVVVIVTDGLENASREWDADGVKKLVEQQQNDYSWEFLFLGANIDSFAVGGSIGVRASNSINYVASAAGASNVWSSTSSVLTSARAGVFVPYTDTDREQAVEQ